MTEPKDKRTKEYKRWYRNYSYKAVEEGSYQSAIDYLNEGGDINHLSMSISLLLEQENYEAVEGVKRAMFEYIIPRDILMGDIRIVEK